jgi:C-terminal processing protease CtpA/Prc
VTWQGRRLVGEGIKPDVEVALRYESVSKGHDNQLETAAEIVRAM